MTLAFGNYDESYPPEVLRGYVAPVLSGAARREAGDDDVTDPTTPPPDLGPESNAPEGAVPVDSTRTEPDGPAVVAVPADQLDEAAVGAEPTPTVRGVVETEDGARHEGIVPASAAVDDDDDEPAEGDAAGSTRFVVSAGKPGSYDPEVPASERPRNVTELRERARPLEREPWLEGEYVLVGTTGKRAHWSGDDWHSGEAPAPEAGTE